MSKYLELFPNSLAHGIGLLSEISSLDDIPWSALDADTIHEIERNYGARSGNKVLASLYSLIPVETLPKTVKAYFGDKWKKLWDAYKATYTPTANYYMNETGKNTRDLDTTEKTDYGRTVTEESTQGGTVGTESSGQNNNAGNVYGFNSSVAVPSDTNSGTNTSTDTETRNLTGSRESSSGGSDEVTKAEDEVTEHNIDRKGSTGIYTTQEMLKQEIALWKDTYFSIVYLDIDNLLMLRVYDMEE